VDGRIVLAHGTVLTVMKRTCAPRPRRPLTVSHAEPGRLDARRAACALSRHCVPCRGSHAIPGATLRRALTLY
jgi:hypothetical protein